ncbi:MULTISPECIES: LysE family translocator [Pseudomonas]|uniref:LysE family translocator n=1 Tax=Pseudomonas donghuensis TaxID=1163398 RepID=A0AAP0SD77_9PSED|nr:MULTISPECIES: LysE family translocator [Pseudomonas]MDF9894350.1 threonine/homoserine/homoserine lactone efflux protein [Pseudomonas vranovensis]KDN98398.1 LysE family translocator [Pseudomonas donghuensis]MBF4208275.1 LysE family translocator [Pseudomonas donghuensis]MBS7596800.1 LysE family translocator [Pseudomonas sp. RC2C2]MCP6692248.1 LysE family translocator [Pseudomonas donghuensis]
MDLHALLAFTLVAAIAIASPGPATLMAINNSLAYGPRYAVWSSLGNASGLFCLSAAAMLGLGALLASSEWLFNAVKILGAGYLFYLGAKQLMKKSPMLASDVAAGQAAVKPSRLKLYKSAFLTAATNPKATMFFTALFPQFIDQSAALLPQFLILTAIFMALSLTSLSLYAALASRAKGVLTRPEFSRWVSRVVGSTFICFGAAILTMRRQGA